MQVAIWMVLILHRALKKFLDLAIFWMAHFFLIIPLIYDTHQWGQVVAPTKLISFIGGKIPSAK